MRLETSLRISAARLRTVKFITPNPSSSACLKLAREEQERVERDFGNGVEEAPAATQERVFVDPPQFPNLVLYRLSVGVTRT
jgi:hypothetical protein